MLILYALTVFLSAFLLFLVQPLIAKYILPWYGGGPGVWTACMLFFQVVLLGGYAYAHLLGSRLGERRQGALHLGVLAVSLAFVSIAPDSAWQPAATAAPTGHILLLLAANVGAPFAVLASTTSLLTRWFSARFPDHRPYRLYALSNAGSLLALLAYPFVVEPALPIAMQARTWSIGYAVFVAACGVCTVNALRTARPAREAHDQDTAAPRLADTALWLGLAATGSVLLLATTNRVCQDLAVVPLLWVAPLGIYLLSFILCFENEGWYRRAIFMPLLAVTALGVTMIMHHEDSVSVWTQIALYTTALFAGTMVCHGELARAKPPTTHATGFYLAIAGGGALGGALVAVAAPAVFPDYWEYPIGLLAAGLLAMLSVRRRPAALSVSTWRRRAAWAAALVLFAAVAIDLTGYARHRLDGALATSRTFFGVIRVLMANRPTGPLLLMSHGRITHGSQFVGAPLRDIPTTYFGYDSGIGIALSRYRALGGDSQRALRMGVIGLGAGTLSAYGQAGDVIRFYEIDPEVSRLAHQYFGYLDSTPAKVEIALGDARLTLAREAQEGGQQYDVLVLDAFSGDAVPTHLLTREAYDLYRSHLRPGGILAFHVSNRYLDLAAVVRGLAEAAGHHAVRIVSTPDERFDIGKARWVIATNNRAFASDRAIERAATPWSNADPPPLVWTDDSTHLWSAIAWNLAPGRWDDAPNGGRFVADDVELIPPVHEQRIREVCQDLYLDSSGRGAILVVTVPSTAATGAPGATFEERSAQLFTDLGVADVPGDRGLLVLIAPGEGRATVLTGHGWSDADEQLIPRIFTTTAGAGLQQGRGSEGIFECVLGLERLVRERLAGR